MTADPNLVRQQVTDFFCILSFCEMSIVSNAFVGLFRSMRAGKKESINSNAIPSPKLGATMIHGLHMGEFESPQYRGKFLVHGEIAGNGTIASCSLVNRTASGRNTYESNGASLTFRTGIPVPNEAPNHGNIKAWHAWCELVNFYHPDGIPAKVEENDGDNAIRFPEQASENKRRSFVKFGKDEVDSFIFGEPNEAEAIVQSAMSSDTDEADLLQSSDSDDVPF